MKKIAFSLLTVALLCFGTACATDKSEPAATTTTTTTATESSEVHTY